MKTTTLRLTAATTAHAEFLTDPVFSECLPGPRLRVEICLPIVLEGRVCPQSAWECFLAEPVAPTFPEGFLNQTLPKSPSEFHRPNTRLSSLPRMARTEPLIAEAKPSTKASMQFRIPKLTDRQLTEALIHVQRALEPWVGLEAKVRFSEGSYLVDPISKQPANIGFEFDLEGQALDSGYLYHTAGINPLMVNRQPNAICDDLILDTRIRDKIDTQRRQQLWFTLVTAARKAFRVDDTIASFQGHEDNAWNRYREAQTQVLASLSTTTERLLVQVAQQNAELDRQRDEKFARLETQLREALAAERAAMEKQLQDRSSVLGQKEKQLAEREAAFETEEARYFTRKRQAEQMKKIEADLQKWNLTEGTTKKRGPILWGYVGAVVCTAGLTGYSVLHSYDLVKTADDLAKLQWWHWLALTSKTLFPLAAFTTFLVSFIRWSSDWAQQHAREEFRNRALLVDIGRSSWLLEAVRDAQEGNKDLPPELLKELAKNLFNGGSESPSENHPQAGIDVLLKGLSSIRVKSPEGAEVEAKRGK
jgi:hypothetical protein